MNDTTVEQYFRGIRDTIKDLQRLFELIVVVMSDGLDPGLDFLFDHAVSFRGVVLGRRALPASKTWLPIQIAMGIDLQIKVAAYKYPAYSSFRPTVSVARFYKVAGRIW